MVYLSRYFLFIVARMSRSYNPIIAVTIMVWATSISLAATLEIDVSFFSSSYLDVSVQRVCSPYGVLGLLPNGLSHSEILGSILVCKSPRLIAAYHVLRRLQEPRHPPYALSYFLTTLTYPYCQYVRLYLISLIVSMNDANFHLLSSTLRFRSSTPFAMLTSRLFG